MSNAIGNRCTTGLSTWPAVALLDALPDATAVLDRHGTIVAVNHAWRMFALDNGGDPGSTGVGANYLQVSAAAAAGGCREAADVVAGLEAVRDGRTVECDLEYGCPSPTFGRWFNLRITPILGPEPGILVSHVNISRHKLAEETLRQQASQDPLTEVSTRTVFQQRLAMALTRREGREQVPDVGLLYIDLDGFKPVNDSYGHAAGDSVLQMVAHRLKEVSRPQNTVARLGGDEFAVLATRITGRGLISLTGRMRVAMARPYLVHGHELQVGASIGTYLAGILDTPAQALARADEAMYVDKAARQARRPECRREPRPE